ncbi:SMP-30/gluconolactonase/LRE family protein [Acidiferrobacter thiooxydans]|uniref:SMP-30/gluconolactonase/LRE family protein n=1 Tax=Acidiferrobacter thiooxydans TaxID=163359 RepID=UPI000826A276|nr:SMP-30/gluconolactonase/LRE family protein [Acidiferrobacter thiooxydans]UEN98959.1 SMP-30/gluconolactonase/LRE family protein [Acidiferrobacter thiooxydans]
MAPYDIIDPSFRSFVLPNAAIETLGTGFRWLEGPVWFADHDCLVFSDIPNDRVLRWSETGGVSVFRSPCGFENGHARDREGRLISCSHRNRCVTRTEWDGRITVLASHYQGRRLNAPNDVVVKSDGSIWFTDPLYGINTDYEGGRQVSEQPPAVYRLDPARAELEVVAGDFEGPNGLCFSPDERVLYIVETGQQFAADPVRHIRRAVLTENGTRLGATMVFHEVVPGGADGLRCDEDGNVWTSAADGVHCLNPQGALLGKIRTNTPVANLAFGGRQRSRLFLCAGQTLLGVYVNRRGAVRP